MEKGLRVSGSPGHILRSGKELGVVKIAKTLKSNISAYRARRRFLRKSGDLQKSQIMLIADFHVVAWRI